MKTKIINKSIRQIVYKILGIVGPSSVIHHCPINEQTGDGLAVGRCWFALDGAICPRHGNVSIEVKHFQQTGRCTLENIMRKRKGLQLLGKKEY